ncbi:MAG: cellulase family glycosylhydrolase, partial [Oligoflexia bacterium]|nr:cellulase family glycosylhydrolase [Oligoflexia bacterium]
MDGNPRLTFVEKWVRQVIQRYKGSPRVVGWEIWNEPNMVANQDNITLD